MNQNQTIQVVSTGDSEEWPRWIADRPRHHDQLMVIDVPPLTRPSTVDVAEAVLTGLGKDRRLWSAKRSADLTAAAWLSVTDRTDAVIADATVLPDDLLDELVTMLEAFGIRPWVVVPCGVYHDESERVAVIDELVTRYGAQLRSAEEFVNAWPDRAATRAAHGRVEEWPIVPRVDGMFFRSAVRDLLDSDDVAFIDEIFCTTVRELRALLDGANGHIRRRFGRQLRELIDNASCDEEVITRVRAAQVAGLTCGYHVAVNPVRLYGACSVLPRRSHAVIENWWEKLARYPDPDVPAVAALHTVGMGLGDIQHLTTEDVVLGDDGREVTVTGRSGAEVTLDGPAATFVRAAVTWRYFGAGPGPLFSTHRAESISDRRIGHLARLPMETGVRHTAVKAKLTEPSDERWLDTFGITIQGISKGKDR